jgi:hypothetical protein
VRCRRDVHWYNHPVVLIVYERLKFSSIKSVLDTERSQLNVVLFHVVFFSFRFSISSLKASVYRGLSSLP